MADNKGAMHLTTIQFDTSLIMPQLQGVQATLATVVQQINTDPEYQIKLNLQTAINEVNKLTAAIQAQEEALGKANALPQNQQNLSLIQAMQSNLNKLLSLQKRVGNQSVFTTRQSNELSRYSTEVSRLSSEMQSAQNSSNGMLKTISDKARWLTAFYLVNQLRQGFIATVKTVKDTETAVVELQRVLNEDVGTVTIQQNLYDLAQEYGRTIEDVSNASIKFAQTGADWNETLALTEATLLAVNTAELEVETATTGLIAVLSQFNIEATDMVDVIDKINITADNFAVTSEKIVAALQRAGGAAMAANLSLEDTIGVITSLSEATGRSGENIGTALNSLISYTQKSGSLDVFSNQSQQMADLVDSYQAGTTSIIALWQGLSTEISRLSEEQQVALSKLMEQDVGYQDFASGLEAEATDITQSLNDIYNTAGVYRRNYFIALLDNMDTYTEALSNMTDAEGYSLAENEKYMETLTAQYNQLIAEVKELAVAFGEAGFLDLLKMLVQMGISTTQVVEKMGGLVNVLKLLSVIIISVKMERLVTAFRGLSVSASSTITNMKLAINSMRGVQTQATATATAVKVLSGALNLAVLALGLITTAVTIFNQKQAEAKQQAIDSTRANLDYTDSLIGMREEYEAIVSSTDDYNKQQQDLADWKDTLYKQYGLEAEALARVNEERKTGIDLINQEIETQYINWLEETRDASKEAIEIMETPITPKMTFDASNLDSLQQAFDRMDGIELGDVLGASALGQTQQLIIEGKTLEEQYNNVNQAIFNMRNNMQSYGENGQFVLEFLELQSHRLKQSIEEQGEQYNLSNERMESYFKAMNNEQVQAIEGMDNFSDKTIAFQELVKEINENLDFSDAVKKSMREWAYSEIFLQQTADVIATFDEVDEIAKGLADNIAKYTGQLENYDKLYDGMDQFNETGQISFEVLQELTAATDKYGLSLSIQNGQLIAVDKTTGDTIMSKSELTKAILQEQLASQLLAITQSYVAQANKDVETTSDDANSAISAFDTAVKNLASSAINTSDDLIPLVATLANVFNAAQGGEIDEGLMDRMQQDLLDTANTHRALASAVYSTGNAYSSTSGSMSETESALESLNKQYEALIAIEEERLKLAELTGKSEEEQIQHLTNLKNLTHEYANALRDLGYDESTIEILQRQTEWQEYQADVVDLIKDKNEDLIDVEEQRLTLAETMGKSEEQQIAHLKTLQALTHDYANALRGLGYSEDSIEILELQTQWQDYQNQIMDLLAQQAEEQKDLIVERWELEIDFLNQQKEQIESNRDAELDALAKVEAENDRIRAKEDYYDRLADAKRDLASAQARSGVEYREAEYDAQQEINDLAQDWQEQIQDWQIEDTKAKINELADAEIQAIEAQIQAIENSIESISASVTKAVSDGNQEALQQFATGSQALLTDQTGQLLALSEAWWTAQQEANTEGNKQNLSSFQTEYISPLQILWSDAVQENSDMQLLSVEEISKNSLVAYQENFINPLQAEMSTLFSYILDMSQSNSMMMYQVYRQNVFDRMRSDVDDIFSGIGSSQSSGTGSSTTYNNSSTSNKNMNMYVDMKESQPTRTITDIFSKFWK